MSAELDRAATPIARAWSRASTASCTKSEIVTVDGDSYRLREAEERQGERAAARKEKGTAARA